MRNRWHLASLCVPFLVLVIGPALVTSAYTSATLMPLLPYRWAPPFVTYSSYARKHSRKEDGLVGLSGASFMVHCTGKVSINNNSLLYVFGLFLVAKLYFTTHFHHGHAQATFALSLHMHCNALCVVIKVVASHRIARHDRSQSYMLHRRAWCVASSADPSNITHYTQAWTMPSHKTLCST